jgi:hypothetical protein
MPLELFLIWIQEQYNLKKLAYKGYMHLEMWQSVRGLPQVGILANKCLRCKLAPNGYFEHISTPSLWYHETWPILFTLVVDDFGVKYVNQEDINHLIVNKKDISSYQRLDGQPLLRNLLQLGLYQLHG